MSGLVVWEIESSVFAVALTSGAVVSPCGAFRRGERAELFSVGTASDIGAPRTPVGSPNNPAIARLVSSCWSSVRAVLGSRRASEVLSAVIQPIPINVIHFVGTIKQESMQQQQLAAIEQTPHGIDNAGSAAMGGPLTHERQARIANIHGGEQPLAERNQGRTVRLKNGRSWSVLAGARTKATPEALPVSKKGRSTPLADILVAHGDLQSLCRAPGLPQASAGVFAARNSTRNGVTTTKISDGPQVWIEGKAA